MKDGVKNIEKVTDVVIALGHNNDEINDNTNVLTSSMQSAVNKVQAVLPGVMCHISSIVSEDDSVNIKERQQTFLTLCSELKEQGEINLIKYEAKSDSSELILDNIYQSICDYYNNVAITPIRKRTHSALSTPSTVGRNAPKKLQI